MWWVVAATLLALAVMVAVAMSRAPAVDIEHNPYVNLPLTPPRVGDPDMQRQVDQLFYTQSNCWHFNHWARVTVPKIMEAVASGHVLHPDALEDKMLRSMEALKQCPPGAWMETPGSGRRIPVSLLPALSDVAKSF